MPQKGNILLPLLFIIVLLAVVYFLYARGIIKLTQKKSSLAVEPKVQLQTKYDNPFDANSQYVNPFSEYKNPFDAF